MTRGRSAFLAQLQTDVHWKFPEGGVTGPVRPAQAPTSTVTSGILLCFPAVVWVFRHPLSFLTRRCTAILVYYRFER